MLQRNHQTIKSKNVLGNPPVNRIAHHERKSTIEAAILINCRTITWGIVIGIPLVGCHIIFHSFPQVDTGIGRIGNLKKVVSRESFSECSTSKVTG